MGVVEAMAMTSCLVGFLISHPRLRGHTRGGWSGRVNAGSRLRDRDWGDFLDAGKCFVQKAFDLRALLGAKAMKGFGHEVITNAEAR